MSQKEHNRTIILFATAVMGCFAGSIYMWSIFNEPLMQIHGWSLQQVSLAYSLFIFVDCISGLFVGSLQKRMKTSTLLLIAGFMFSAGWFLTGFAQSVPMLYLAFCVLAGTGDGFVYNIVVSTATKWYPDKPGFANGVCVGCIGLSALFFAPLGNFLIESFGAENSFKIFGVFAMVLFFIFARFVNAPKPGWKPEGWDPDLAKSHVESAPRDFSIAEVLKSPLFWVLWLVYCLGVIPGNMIAAHASNMGQALATMTASQGALLVGVMAIGSFCGRFGFGTLSDRIGCCKTIAIMMIICGCDMVLFTQVSTFELLAVALCVSGACFGGMMSVVPSICSRLFGNGNFSQIYAILYSAYMVACFLGPQLAAITLQQLDSYTFAFMVAGVIAIASLCLVFLVRRMGRVS